MNASPRPSARAAFTLIELLVVVAIISMLMALIGGGIRKSMDSAKKRRDATAREAVRTAIMTFWHDTGEPPIQLRKGYYTYVYDWTGRKADQVAKTGTITNTTDDVATVLKPLTDPDSNPLKKTYLTGNDQYMKSIKRIKYDLTSKNATVE